MKKILTLVDFSNASINALAFAAELSKRNAAHLTIINIVKKGENEKELRKMLDFLVSEVKKSFGSDLDCDSSMVHGEFISILNKTVKAEKPDLVVMGTKGASGLKKLLIGSNTVNVISNINVPVLVIPEVARFKNFINKGKNRVILATDLDSLENEGAIDILKEITLLIKEPKVRVLSVRPKTAELSVLQHMERDVLLSIFNPEIESERVTVYGSNVIKGINFYLNQKNTDSGLIAMIARDSGGLIKKHYTREMTSHTHLPLLVLHDTKL